MKITATTLSLSKLMKQLNPGDAVPGSKPTVTTTVVDPNNPNIVALRPGGLEDPKIK